MLRQGSETPLDRNSRPTRCVCQTGSTIMNRPESETEYLRQCMAYDNSAERRRLEEQIARVQNDQRSLRRAMWLLGWLTAPAVAVLGYGALFLDYFPETLPPLVLMIVSTLGLGAAVCLLAFAGLEVVYRRELDQRRAECLRLLARILASHLGEPVNAPAQNLRENVARGEDSGTARAANEINGSHLRN
jgi:hypothetical protein